MNESGEQPENRPSWHYILLWIVALTSLALNVYLVVGFNNFQRVVKLEAGRVSQMLDGITFENYEVPISVDETLDVSVTIPFSDTIEVPISTTVPVSTSIVVDETISVPIEEVIRLDTDVQVNLPVLGRAVPVEIPIQADVPISLETEVPVNLEVPVAVEIPIDLLLEVPVDTAVPVEAQVPVQMEFPVTVSLEEMGLDALLMQMQEGLQALSGGE
jgi:hypothetical protein